MDIIKHLCGIHPDALHELLYTSWMKVHVTSYIVDLASDGHPSVIFLVVLFQLGQSYWGDNSFGARQIDARPSQADPVHQRVARLKGGFIPRVACK